MLYPAVFAILLQILVGLKIISIEYRTFPCFLFDVFKQSFCRNIWNCISINSAISLENSKYCLLIESTSSTVTFASSSKIRFIRFNKQAVFGILERNGRVY